MRNQNTFNTPTPNRIPEGPSPPTEIPQFAKDALIEIERQREEDRHFLEGDRW